MWRRSLYGVALAVLMPACGSPEAAEDDQVAAGATLFAQHCAQCHGEDLKAATGMTDLREFSGDFSDFESTVTTGRGIMPSFGGVFTDEELAALYAYIRSGGPMPGTEER